MTPELEPIRLLLGCCAFVLLCAAIETAAPWAQAVMFVLVLPPAFLRLLAIVSDLDEPVCVCASRKLAPQVAT